MMLKNGDLVNVVWKAGDDTVSIPVDYIMYAMEQNPHRIIDIDGVRLEDLSYYWGYFMLELDDPTSGREPDWEI